MVTDPPGVHPPERGRVSAGWERIADAGPMPNEGIALI
jgi:hypothetical protein